MFWALVAPELVLVWSAKQWFVAGKIADFYNAKKGEINITNTSLKAQIFLRGMRTQGLGEGISSYVKNTFRGKEDAETQGICVHKVPHTY